MSYFRNFKVTQVTFLFFLFLIPLGSSAKGAGTVNGNGDIMGGGYGDPYGGGYGGGYGKMNYPGLGPSIDMTTIAIEILRDLGKYTTSPEAQSFYCGMRVPEIQEELRKCQANEKKLAELLERNPQSMEAIDGWTSTLSEVERNIAATIQSIYRENAQVAGQSHDLYYCQAYLSDLQVCVQSVKYIVSPSQRTNEAEREDRADQVIYQNPQ